VDYYPLTICGITRKLPLIQIGRKTKIASFSILGDAELVDKIATQMAKKLKRVDFDYLVGPEVKVVPLLQSLSEKLGKKRFIVCRKSAKQYMISPIILLPLSHFPKHSHPLVINGEDVKLLKNKKVVIIDDVVSTGITLRMVNKLMTDANAKIVTRLAVIKQGNQFDKNLKFDYLSTLPIIKDKHPIDTPIEKPIR